jgi:hypothetical protein
MGEEGKLTSFYPNNLSPHRLPALGKSMKIAYKVGLLRKMRYQ